MTLPRPRSARKKRQPVVSYRYAGEHRERANSGTPRQGICRNCPSSPGDDIGGCPLPQPGGLRGIFRPSADEGEVVQRLRSGLVQEVEHELSGDPVEVAGATDDVDPEVVLLNVAPYLHVAEAADLTVEVIGPLTVQRVVRADLAQTTATTDPVSAILWIEQLSPEPERGFVRVRVEDLLFDNREVVIERGRGWDRKERQPEYRESRGQAERAPRMPSSEDGRDRPTLTQRRHGVKTRLPTFSSDTAYSRSPAASRAWRGVRADRITTRTRPKRRDPGSVPSPP